MPKPTPSTTEVLGTYTSSHPESEYNLTVVFEGDWTADLQEDVIDAVDFISSIVLGDLRDVDGVDDLEVTASLEPIDGGGGIVGSGASSHYRTAEENYLPYRGTARFDDADAERFDNMGLWDDIVLHEFLHTMGFGLLWRVLGLVDDDWTMFFGENANAAFQTGFRKAAKTYDFIPIDGPHWAEEVFDRELMTPILDTKPGPTFSDMTIASLEDMGYDTVWVM